MQLKFESVKGSLRIPDESMKTLTDWLTGKHLFSLLRILKVLFYPDIKFYR